MGVETQTSVSPTQLATLVPREPAWAFPIQKGNLPELPPGPQSIPGSTKTYTPEEIDNLLAPPDWLPNDHPPAPPIVQKGHAGALACGSCHLMSGIGHPESADVTGLSAEYLMQQMKDFKSGDRKDGARMNGIAKELTDEETQRGHHVDGVAEAAQEQLDRRDGHRAEDDHRARDACASSIRPAAPSRAGARILTVPVDLALARLRDPNTAFMSYVAVGTLARGKTLVETGDGGKTIACGTCHGKTMTGQVMPRKDMPGTQVPRMAGQHPMYLARQLHLFKDGSRNGGTAAS